MAQGKQGFSNNENQRSYSQRRQANRSQTRANSSPLPPFYGAEPLEQRLLLAVLYVDLNAPGPLHDGSSWDSAYADLQPALIHAQAGDQIRIAAGTYKPTADADRTQSFRMKSGVSLYGGYAGHNAADPNQRDIQLFPTLLSGEIGDPSTISDNSYHVVYANKVNSSVTIDGLTITAGNANGSDTSSRRGGGMYNYDSSSLILRNCSFTDNSAHSGGAIFNNSSPILRDCVFIRNSASTYGGAILAESSTASAILINCVFNGNSAGMCGGGVCNYSGATLNNCTFVGNSADHGGGMYNYSSSPKITNCTFSGNLAADGYGGAIYNLDSSSATLVNCILWENGEDQIANEYKSTADVSYTLVQGGYAGNGNLDADPQFVHNPNPGPDGRWGTPDDDYGDLHLRPTSPAINAGNNAVLPLDLDTDLAGNPRLVGKIVDLGPYETPDLPATVTFVASAQQVSEDAGTLTITLNLSQPLQTPVTVPLLLNGTAASGSDYRLLGPNPIVFEPGSTSASVRIEILDDNPFEPAEILMLHLGELNDAWYGAIAIHTITILRNDEPPLLYVDDTASGANNGSSWADAYTSLQAACQAVQVGGTILVAAGTYNPGTLRTESFQLRNHVAICGGFPDGGGTWQQRNPVAHPAILSGEIGDPNTAEDNSYHVVSANGVDSTAILDGLTITAGNANRFNDTSRGGGIYNCSSSPTVINCTFSGNAATWGGAMANDASSPVLINCTFVGNMANSGGGMYNERSSFPTLTNCTLAGNVAKLGVGIYNYDGSSTLANCILWGNMDKQIIDVYHSHPTHITYSLIERGWEGIGNLEVDPQFIRNPSPGPDGLLGTPDDDYGDLHLCPTSPALNAGLNAALPSDLTTDLAGNPRLIDGTVDLGAYESQGPKLLVAGSATDTFYLRVNDSTLEIFRNTQPGQASPTQSIPLSTLSQLRLQGGQYTLASNLAGLELYLENDSQVRLTSSQHLAFLSLNPTATLDLADHDLIVSATPETKAAVLAALSSAIQSARGSDAAWAGTGLTSSAAAANPYTGLSVILNADKDGNPLHTTFAGQAVGVNDVLIKYTWNGDVNLDGKIDIDDYFFVDSGFILKAQGYRNGDLNFDGQIDIDDYFLIDSAFIVQNAPMGSQPAPTLSAPATPKPPQADSVLQHLFSTNPLL